MPCNKFYLDERELYKSAFLLELTLKEIQDLKTKMFKAFNVPDIEVKVKSNGRNFYYYKGKIHLDYPCEMGVLAHEIAHHIQYTRTGQTKHYKPLLLLIGEVIQAIKAELPKHESFTI